MGPQLNRAGELVIKAMEKTKVLGTFFTSGFTAKVCLQESWALNHWERLEWGWLTFGRAGKGWGTFEQMGLRQIHRTWCGAPMGDEGAGHCHCKDTFDHLWKVMVIRGVAWGLQESKHHSSFYNKDKREDLGNWSASPCYLGRCLSHSWKVFSNVLRTAWGLGVVSKDFQRGHLLWLISFYSEMTWLSGQGESSGVYAFWL